MKKIILLVMMISLQSCATKYITEYQVIDSNNNKYNTNSYNKWGDCITFDEVNRHGIYTRSTILCKNYKIILNKKK